MIASPRDADRRDRHACGARAYREAETVERVADAKVMYLKLTPEQVEAQKRFGVPSDNIEVKAKFATTFTDHGMQVLQLLLFLEINNEVELETDLVFAGVFYCLHTQDQSWWTHERQLTPFATKPSF